MPSWPVWKGRKSREKDPENDNHRPNDAPAAAQEGRSSTPVPTSAHFVELTPLDRTLSISSLRVRDINLPTSTPSATAKSTLRHDGGALPTHVRPDTPSSMKAPTRPDSANSVASIYTHQNLNPKIARIRPHQTTPSLRHSPSKRSSSFVSQPMPVDKPCNRTTTGVDLYHLSHADPSLLGPYNYIIGLDALRNITPPVLVPRAEYGHPLFKIQTIHPRDRALLLILMYAGLPHGAGDPTVRHWLAPFSLDGDELRCWRDEDEVQNKDGCVTYPVQTTLDLHTFASQLRDWQIGEMEKRIRVSMPLRPPAVPAAAAAHSTFEHVESVRHVTGGGVQDRVRAEPTELYAYRFSRAAPLGEVYDPARSGSRKSKKDLTRTGTGTGTGTVRKYPPTSTASANRNNHTHSHLNNAGQGEGGVGQRPGPGISITRVFKNGKDAYRHSTYAKSFKVVYGLALGISVVGIVVAVCFFRLGQKGQKFGEG